MLSKVHSQIMEIRALWRMVDSRTGAKKIQGSWNIFWCQKIKKCWKEIKDGASGKEIPNVKAVTICATRKQDDSIYNILLICDMTFTVDIYGRYDLDPMTKYNITTSWDIAT